MSFGGTPPGGLAITESWNGTSWTEVADLANGRFQLGQAGANTSSALAFGGILPPGANTAATEEWTAPLANKTITAS